MKTLAKSLVFIFAICIYNLSLYAQSNNDENQNPRFKEAKNKYIKNIDALTKNQGTTIQQTYKAFDWYEDKMKKKAQRDLWRHLERMERAKNGTLYYYDSSWGFPNYYSSPYWGVSPYINYRWTNWDFGLRF